VTTEDRINWRSFVAKPEVFVDQGTTVKDFIVQPATRKLFCSVNLMFLINKVGVVNKFLHVITFMVVVCFVCGRHTTCRIRSACWSGVSTR